MAAKGESPIAAHGSVDMPVWGPIFLAGSGATSSETEQHVNDLVKYIESLQSNLEAAKPVAPLSTSGH
jgi:hypothetical protein